MDRNSALWAVAIKNHCHKGELIPCYLLSRQVCSLAFEASGIEPVLPLAFKANGMSTAPMMLRNTRGVLNVIRKLNESTFFVSL